MDGGIVTEVCDVPGRDNLLFVDCIQKPGVKYSKQKAIFVVKNQQSLQIQIGDYIRWDKSFAYWRPQHYKENQPDIQLLKVGRSGVNIPRKRDIK